LGAFFMITYRSLRLYMATLFFPHIAFFRFIFTEH